LPIRDIPVLAQQQVLFQFRAKLIAVLSVKGQGPGGGRPGADEEGLVGDRFKILQQTTADI